MRTPDLRKALESFSTIMAEKKNMSEKEREVIGKVNRAIGTMGYQIVQTNGQSIRKRRGRPVGSRNKPKQPMHSVGITGDARRRAGRPKLKKVA
jgi:hypothetical protein